MTTLTPQQHAILDALTKAMPTRDFDAERRLTEFRRLVRAALACPIPFAYHSWALDRLREGYSLSVERDHIWALPPDDGPVFFPAKHPPGGMRTYASKDIESAQRWFQQLDWTRVLTPEEEESAIFSFLTSTPRQTAVVHQYPEPISYGEALQHLVYGRK